MQLDCNERTPSASQGSDFLRSTQEGYGISAWLFLVSLALGAGAGLYFGSWSMAVITWGAAYLCAALLYAGLGHFLGWPRLRWFGFFGVIADAILALSAF
jgi:hypothetical protein